MNVFHNKYYVFFISAGRTGTRFFGNLLQNIIDNCISVHELDVLTPRKEYQVIEKLKMFGFYHMLFGKILGKTGIRNLSQNYISGKISFKQLKKVIIKHRSKYYEKILPELIIESYSGWYGCIPAIQDMYKNYKIVVIVRDPKDWVTSNMNWGSLYGKKDWVSKFGLERLNPKMVNDQEYMIKWDNFSRFEKICWTYKTQYEIMLENINDDPNAIMVKFEDLFHSPQKYDNFKNLIEFITDFSGKRFTYTIPDNILNKKVHKNISYEFPTFKYWKSEYKESFFRICKTISNKLKY